jgi:hypothetical protein
MIALLIFLQANCSSSSKERSSAQSEYTDKIEIKVTLGPPQNLSDLDEEDVFYAITNHGDETVTKVYGEIVFYDQDRTEIGRDSILFLEKSKKMEGVAAEGKKARWQSLAPGQTMNDSYELLYLLGGKPELREELRQRWDDLTASAEIKKIEMSSY